MCGWLSSFAPQCNSGCGAECPGYLPTWVLLYRRPSGTDFRYSQLVSDHVDSAELRDNLLVEMDLQKHLSLPGGRLLGGSSAINAQAFIAASKVGLDVWKELGNGGWDWDSMEPYYKKCHTVEIPSDKLRKELGLNHLTPSNNPRSDGPIQTSYSPKMDAFRKAWIDTFNALNIWGAVAKGVKVTIKGVEHIFQAGKEVIVAAGALNSPKILELSGIGGAKLLSSLGIDLYVENSDLMKLRHWILSRQEPKAIAAAMSAYQTEKTGPFAGAAISSFAYMPVPDFQTPKGKAELEHLLLTHEPVKESVTTEFARSVLSSADKSSACYFVYAAHGNFGSDASSAKNITISHESGNFLTLACELGYPLSRGSVHIQSSSALDSPIINPKYFSNPIDLDIHARFIRYIHNIAATGPMASNLKPGGHISPSFAAFGTELEAAKDYVRRTMISAWHPCGTCAMLPLADGGVLNQKLIVYGTKNIRVVDASMIPLTPRGNLQSTVYAVAERAADLIKLDHNI
ncbi:hypothetical protein BOTNAR_0271g00040 [Botryotinia narcissicola]|uniref:Glucose-methanol-choline oxidoreductase N-terminal domain-containing protein n=1 Tax=Botryotinia narcissicola TaxID=278944 RepID=A0A4Z1I4E3_9HELO|nr:hypothetical protein BOTNAR_0271g00040 [Botryotinia narcissicola]